MSQALRRILRAILARLPSSGSADSPSTPATTEAWSQPTRDLAVVIPTPPGAAPDIDAPPLGRLLVERRATRPQDVTLAVIQQGEGDDRPLGEILVAHGATTAAHVVAALEHQAEVKRSAAGTTARVDVALLGALVQLVAELARTRDDLLARADGVEDATVTRLDHLSTELQDLVSTLLQPPTDAAGGAGS